MGKSGTERALNFGCLLLIIAFLLFAFLWAGSR
jgi:hypothetical protein